MQISMYWSLQALKVQKGNHRRTAQTASFCCGVIGNTYDTPSFVKWS